jgi:large subunit ribosomal protein L5
MSNYIPTLKKLYTKEIVSALNTEFGYKSIMQVPKLQKIIVSAGIGEAIANKKAMESTLEEFAIITGQKPVKTKARLSIANFKLRKDFEVGAKVTLRGTIMFEFLERLIGAALPRVKDFRGLNPNGFDGRGNYSMGITEQIIFPEIDYDKIEKIRGFNIAFVTTAKTDQEARSLLARLGMPFRK